ncbi:hypothetical protein M2347_001731 [Chryseobacterium sp. H1D6B]|uniref:hypothetical protein n=1 Tax=Chryseobacterium sp. H1D6B TaxID=2940588 RepID=UPI0015C91F96|nr:hypothetical protein [Chryseobacterium sp. H1D6B]MDH6252004.1 hypothetical protein [Chryseobacterium sp. H1D6B]
MRNLLITTAVFFGICSVYLLIMLSKTENHFTYIIDDAYIHMAMAKNFALYKVWGMTPYSFSSSSSSPVFTLILSTLIYIFGNNELIPLIFNVTVSFFILFFLNKYYSLFFKESNFIIAATIFTIFFAVLHLQIMIGMEHVLQVLVTIISIYYFYKWAVSNFSDKISSYWFYATILLLGLIRFESMFYFVSLSFVFCLVKKIKQAALILLFGFAPILIFGYFNYQQDGYFFPNSVIVKGRQFEFSGNYIEQVYNIVFNGMFFNRSFYKIGFFPLLIGIVLVYRSYKNKIGLQKIVSDNFLVIVWCIVLILHSLFSNFKGFFRYEAYILVGFAMVIIPRLKEFFIQPLVMLKKDKIMTVLILFNILLLFYKLEYANRMLVNGSKNIYEQQVQSAKFLNTYYNTSKIVANDIGAICYFSDIHLLDIAGLGSTEMIPFNEKERVFGYEFEKFLENYCVKNNYQVAVIYEEWFRGHVPKKWKKAAVLKIDHVIAVSSGLVTIYSVDPTIHEKLKQNIKSFKWNKNVKVEIIE